MAYVLVMPNLVEVGENFRFRFLADPLVYTMIAAILQRSTDTRRAECSASSTETVRGDQLRVH